MDTSSAAEHELAAAVRALDAVGARVRELAGDPRADLALTVLPAIEAARTARAHVDVMISLLMERAFQLGASPTQMGFHVGNVRP
jgi:hypothetical protein